MKIIKTRTLTYCVIDHKEAKVSDYVVAKLVKPVFTSIVYPLAHTVELLESGLKNLNSINSTLYSSRFLFDPFEKIKGSGSELFARR